MKTYRKPSYVNIEKTGQQNSDLKVNSTILVSIVSHREFKQDGSDLNEEKFCFMNYKLRYVSSSGTVYTVT